MQLSEPIPSEASNLLKRVDIGSIPLSVRAHNVLSVNKIITLYDLATLSREKLLKYSNCGKKTADELENYLSKIGLRFGMNGCDIADYLNVALKGVCSDKGYVEVSETNSELVALLENRFGSSKEQSASCSNLINGSQDACAIEDERRKYYAIVFSLPLSSMTWSVRACNVFKDRKINFLYELVSISKVDMLGIGKIGKKTLNEFETNLQLLDLRLGMQLCHHVHGLINTNENLDALLNKFKSKYPEKYDALNQIKTQSIGLERINRYRKCYDLYKNVGTLAGVAKEIGCTRERVRQLLVKGTKLNLFKYNGREYVYIPREQLLEVYSKTRSKGKASRALKISTAYLDKLLTAYKLTEERLRKIRLKQAKEKCIREYELIKQKINGHPTTTIMQKNPKWRALWARIARYWGSMEAFREAFDIPRPPQGNPKFKEHTRKWHEYKKRMALVLRMQHLDDVRDCLKANELMSLSSIASACKLNDQRLYMLLNLLRSTGEVIPEGRGKQVKYKLQRA